MEIKVFKDVSKRDKTMGGLTGAQWFLIVGLLVTIGLDVGNALYGLVPTGIFRGIFFPLLGLISVNAMFRPHGYTFLTWVKLNFKYQTTIQVRTYQTEEGIEKYSAKDFKKSKKLKETAQNKGC